MLESLSERNKKIQYFLTIFAKTGHDRCWMLVAIASFREVRMIYSCIQLKTANLKNGKWFSKGTHSHTCKAGQPQNHTTKLRPKLTIAEYMSHKIWPPPFKLHFFFPIFNFKLEEIMILGQKHMIFCLKKKHVLKGLLFQQLLFDFKLKDYADLKEHFFFIFSSQCLSTEFFLVLMHFYAWSKIFDS